MKFMAEYRDPIRAAKIADSIRRICTRPWVLMEICGGQTHSIIRYGIDQMLPDKIELVHGPGCPVCVTPIDKIDCAIVLAEIPNLIFCTFGDMLRVPGSHQDLFSAKAQGADVRIVYSPMDALQLAERNPDREVVFFAIGFETTAPANAMAIYMAHKKGIQNFSVIVSHVLVPPAMESILSATENRVQGFLAAGHVCTVMGYHEYAPISAKYKTPIVITGFEPLDLLEGIYLVVRQLEEGRFEVENQYTRAVSEGGNPVAQDILKDVFVIVKKEWRGLGAIEGSGLTLSEAYRKFDAEIRFREKLVERELSVSPVNCISGLILQGIRKPHDCEAFDNICHPDNPLGATMVSNEGACAAYWKYRRFDGKLNKK